MKPDLDPVGGHKAPGYAAQESAAQHPFLEVSRYSKCKTKNLFKE